MLAELKIIIMKRILTLTLVLLFAILSIYSQINNGFYFSEDFENPSRFSQWDITVLSGETSWILNSGLPYGDVENAESGNFNASYSSYNYNGDRAILSSPRIDLSLSINPVLRFSYVQPVWSIDQDSLNLYYKSSIESDWTLLCSYADNVEAWTAVSIALPDASSDYYIAFEAISGYGYGTGIDNITIVKGEQCPIVTGIEISNIKETSVSIRWHEALCNSFEIEYGETGFEHGSGTRISGIKKSSAIINGLIAGGEYDFYFRAFCAEGISEWSDTIQITTECGIGVVLPYIESFENTINHFECWDVVYANADFHPGNEVVAVGNNVFEGEFALRFSSFEAGAPYNQYLISPVISVDEFTELSFMYKSVEGSSEIFQIGFSPNESVSEVSVQWSETITNADNEWKQYNAVIPSGTKRIFIHYETQFGYYLYIDKLRIGHPVDCQLVENIVVDEIGVDYAILSWTANENVIAVEYGLAGFEKGTGTKVCTNGISQIKIENLIAFTQYSFYGLTDCEGSIIYSDAVGFTTYDECAQVNSIFVEEIGLNFAQLGWTTNNQQTLYNIEYGFSGFEKGTGINVENLTSPEVYIENLLPNTEYDLFVQAVCPLWGNQALWSDAYSFKTNKKDDDIANEVLEDLFAENFDQEMSVVSISSAKPVIYLCGNDSELCHIDLILKNEGSVLIESGTEVDFKIEDLSTGLVISEKFLLAVSLNPGETYLFSTIHGFDFNYEYNPVCISLSGNNLSFKNKKVELSFVRLVTDFSFDGSQNNIIEAATFPIEISATVNSNSDNYSIANSYSWSNGDIDNVTLVYQGGDYLFTVSNEYCSVVKSITIKSIGSENESDNFQIFPNPSHGVITITNVISGSPVSLNVYDAAGRLVYAETIAGPEQTIDLTTLSTGMYSAYLTQEGNSELKRLFIE